MLSRLSAALVLSVLAFACLASACDNAEEEVASKSSADEVIDLMSAAMSAVRSYQTEDASISDQLYEIQFPGLPTQEPEGPQVEYTLAVTVGDDSYDVQLTPPDSCTDFEERCLTAILEACDGSGAQCHRDLFGESLWYGKTYYHRTSSGTWSDDDDDRCDESGCVLSHTISVGSDDTTLSPCGSSPSAPASTPVETSLAAMYRLLITDPERLDDVTIDGTRLIHLRGKQTDPLDLIRSMRCDVPTDTLSPDEQEMFDLMSQWFPDRFDGTVDLWIDPQTYLLARTLNETFAYNDHDVLLQHDINLSLFSDFSTAELPGPLPTQ